MHIMIRAFGILPLLSIALVVNLVLLARHHGVPASVVMRDSLERYHKHPSTDEIAPAFRQSSPLNCGPAAMTYLLTRMGDFVFEGDFTREIPNSNSPDGYSFLELAEFAAIRGFAAAGYDASLGDLPSPGDPPVIAHLARGHFVVLHSIAGEHATLFDPAYGRTFSIGLDEFAKEWSGKILRVQTSDLD